ncbi:hypothetical protein CU633_17855 [Bacillus sp. V3-13]|uniref:glycosyltransferase family 4 protein n=1 Tax=Bacillus sp. V3-13 TaxID=2053728 RepID=UPI000C78105C|nr:glycosyltransferase family 4 protein [Bacillus sp. V3-13]PLR76025.1 hypothetical protein CU633_17855 [Bacillus sp. V3-13]
MKVLVTDNAHLYKTPDGKYYTPSIYNYEFFQRYLNVFDEVRFVSKTKYVNSIDESKFLLVSRKGLEIYELPWYQGLKGLIKNIFKLIFRYRKVFDGCDCYIFRVAQLESYLAYLIGNSGGKPYALEIVNDPAASTDVKGIFKWINVYTLKFMVKRAHGVSYVTKNYLQKKYPRIPKSKVKSLDDSFFEGSYSSIELPERYILKPKRYTKRKNSFEVIHVANTINGFSKGHKTLIEVIRLVSDKGYNVTACCIGDGDSVSEFQQYAQSLGISERIKFTGRIHSNEVLMHRLAQSDLFLFPSYYEGLPRSVIEAQAAGLPCLSTPVGGIPELLPEKYLFKPDDSPGFADKLIELINNPEELEQMSHYNIKIAKNYSSEKLSMERNAFYKKLQRLAKNNEF